MAKRNFEVTFWGVRGSLPVPGPHTIKYGGNTSCVQVQIDQRLFILDAGTGIYHLGQHLLKSQSPISGEIFISHTHWDHIQGFPFFAPAFIKGNRFILYGQSKVNSTFADLMKGQMIYQHFPVSLEGMGARIEFHELDNGSEMDLGEQIRLRTVHTNHPNGSLAYRLDYDGRSCCYITDTEHYSCVDPHLKAFCEETDLMIYDSNYTDEEYPRFLGYGHSTWQEGIKLAQAAGAKKLVLFHHDKARSDEEMEKIEKEAQRCFPNCIAAREGLVIAL
ncbi:MBL fold metallo-hydrolase [Syntrophomonas wolfei]|jgi:phosphoribosyl 1,2-cyclic phosphodiesterase|nr:MBL fold metallo-hydrolase [Syntrophomonas wolfei]